MTWNLETNNNMKQLKGKNVLYVIVLTLHLLATPGVSQEVLVNTTKKETVLNDKGTKAVGNLLREGEGYQFLAEIRGVLIDSLRKEAQTRKKEAFNFEQEAKKWKAAFSESKVENRNEKDKFDIKEAFYKSEIKTKTIGGITVGLLAGLLVMLLFGG